MIKYLPMPILTMDNILRFWDKVSGYSDPYSCWLWTAYKDEDGYGTITISYQPYRANRISYWMHNSIDPKEFEVCHTCHNPPCVNPKHLTLGTSSGNKQQSVSAGRWVHQKGNLNNRALFDEETIREIRSLKDKHSAIQLSAMFNCSKSHITSILNRSRWSHI